MVQGAMGEIKAWFAAISRRTKEKVEDSECNLDSI